MSFFIKQFLKKIKILVGLFFDYLFLSIWWLELLIPRNSKVAVFGSWSGVRFADNSRILFEYINQTDNKIKPIWLTRNLEIKKQLNNQNYKCYMINSFKGIYYSLIAKHIFYCGGISDVNYKCINGAIITQLWHGVPMKKIGLDVKKYYKKSIFNTLIKPFSFKSQFSFHHCLSTSYCFNKIMPSIFGIDSKDVIKVGYPRNDVFSAKIKTLPFIERIKKQYSKPTIIAYLPTFRQSGNADYDYFFQFGFNEDVFEDFLIKNNCIFLYKGHFVINTESNYNDNKRFNTISNEDIDDSLNTFLQSVDILITDYSGVYFDFLLTEKPIIHSVFDIDFYLSDIREMYFDYNNEIVCGPVAEKWSDIMVSISELLSNDHYRELRKKRNKYFNSNNKASNCKYLYNYFWSG